MLSLRFPRGPSTPLRSVQARAYSATYTKLANGRAASRIIPRAAPVSILKTTAADRMRATTALECRPLATTDEFAACVALQRATWGDAFHEVVPEALLRIVQRLGGVVSGAFDGTELVGFVFGLTGLEDGRLVHWSHMLAVLPAWRDRGVGSALKRHQRAALAATGVETIAWTFDPLVARNAHLNLNRLGARVCRYVPDMYGDTGSGLHVAGTDRLVVTWPVEGAEPEAAAVPDGIDAAPIVKGRGRVAASTRHVRIEIPSHVDFETAEGVAAARAWRASSRSAFLHWLGMDWQVRCFHMDSAGRSFYVLEREAT